MKRLCSIVVGLGVVMSGGLLTAAPPLVSPSVQGPHVYRSYEPRYVGVEQTVEDVSLLARSMRSLQSGLQRPSGFESVFRVPDDPNYPGSQARLMRIDGAVAATFPQSVYMGVYLRERRFVVERTTKIGEMPLIPPGTVFRIGLPETTLATLEQRPAPETAIAPESATQRADAEPFASSAQARSTRGEQAPQRRSSQGPDWTLTSAEGDEEARSDRIRSLLLRAAQAEQTSKPD